MAGSPVGAGDRLILPVGGWEGGPRDCTALWFHRNLGRPLQTLAAVVQCSMCDI